MITILLADDHELLSSTVADRINREPDMRVVARVGDGSAVVGAVREHRPDILLLDIDMPGTVSFDAAREALALHPRMRVIYLSAFHTDRFIQDAIDSGGAGYVTKDEPAEHVIEAIRLASEGGAYYSPRVRDRLVADPERGLILAGGSATRLDTLSRREIEVLRYVAQGLTKKQIAERVHRSVSTIDKHVENIMRKLDIHDRVDLARFAIREGLAQA